MWVFLCYDSHFILRSSLLVFSWLPAWQSPFVTDGTNSSSCAFLTMLDFCSWCKRFDLSCSVQLVYPILFWSSVLLLLQQCPEAVPQLHCRTWGAQIAPLCCPVWIASLFPHCLQHHSGKDPLDGHQCPVVQKGQLLSDVAIDLLLSWWLETRQDGPAVSQEHCWLGAFLPDSQWWLQGVWHRLRVSSLLTVSLYHRLPHWAARREIGENSTFTIFRCCFCCPICVSFCPGGGWVDGTQNF